MRGCAFCHLAQHNNPRYVETLLNDAVIDVAQRDAWRAARGLCSWHAEMALKIPQSAGSLAILYDDIVGHDLHALTAVATPVAFGWRLRRALRTRLQQWLRAWRSRAPCPACRLWLEQEQLCFAVLLDDWQEPDLQQAFAASHGLCWPHLLRLVEQGNRHVHLQALLTAQQQHLQALQKDLREFLRKQDYRFAHESYGEEADAWQRAVTLYAGTHGWRGTGRPLSSQG